MDYLVSGPVNIDAIYPLLPSGYGTPQCEIGGGGIYALSGIKLWTDSCMPVVYVGTDYEDYYGGWFEENGIVTDGMTIAFDETVKTKLYYQPDGRYEITWSPGDLGTGRATPNLQLLKPFLKKGVKGLHLVAHGNTVLFRQLAKYREKLGIKIGYEINNVAEYYVDVQTLIEQSVPHLMDYFSLSFSELKDYYPQITRMEEAIELCRSWKCWVYLRCGKNGACLVRDDIVVRVPMIDDFGTIDPTGCGNSSTSSVFWALCEGYDPEMAAVLGGMTAALNASCRGLIPSTDEPLRKKCMDLTEKRLVQLRKAGALR